jgi:hypothetical protein
VSSSDQYLGHKGQVQVRDDVESLNGAWMNKCLEGLQRIFFTFLRIAFPQLIH